MKSGFHKISFVKRRYFFKMASILYVWKCNYSIRIFFSLAQLNYVLKHKWIWKLNTIPTWTTSRLCYTQVDCNFFFWKQKTSWRYWILTGTVVITRVWIENISVMSSSQYFKVTVNHCCLGGLVKWSGWTTSSDCFNVQ